MSKTTKRYTLIISWVLLILWMIFIFINSADQGSESSSKSDVIVDRVIKVIYNDFDNFDAEHQKNIKSHIVYIVRKGAHITEFAVLGTLTSILMLQYIQKPKVWYPSAIAASVFYAATDEFHQLFVPGRSGQIKDVCIDSIGVIAGCTFIFVIYIIRKKLKSKKAKQLQ